MADTGKPESAQDKGLKFVKANFADAVVEEGEFHGQLWVTVAADRIHDVVAGLKADGGFDMLEDLTAVDYLDRPEVEGRFRVVYHLFSLASKGVFRVKAFVDDEDEAVPTVVDVFPGANWLEREVYDMFGIEFAGHPDLRRILMPEDWEGHPCRRDYPWHGRKPITDPMRERDFDRKTVEES